MSFLPHNKYFPATNSLLMGNVKTKNHLVVTKKLIALTLGISELSRIGGWLATNKISFIVERIHNLLPET